MIFQRTEEKLDHCKILIVFFCVCVCVLEYFYLQIIVLDLIKIYVRKRILLSALGNNWTKQVEWRKQRSLDRSQGFCREGDNLAVDLSC